MTPDRCSRCVLPAGFPGIRFDDEGICNICRESPNLSFVDLRNEVETFIRNAVGKAPTYDIVLAFSGGKDSTYTLKYLKETFDARIVAITIDNGFISDRAYENCRKMPESLGVDHLFFKPNPWALVEIYNKSQTANLHSMAALKRASAICNSCIQVINTQILNFASNYRIPVVAGGYIGGQIPSETGFMVQNMKVTKKIRKNFLAGLSARLSPSATKLFELDVSDDDITVVNPLIYLNLSEDAILEEIAGLGWVKPTDTGGSSTNCRLNDYAIHLHQKQHAFHPYIFEIANSVRCGLMSREHALARISAPFKDEDFAQIREQLARFG